MFLSTDPYADWSVWSGDWTLAQKSQKFYDMFRFTKYKPSVLKTLEQTCSETHFRIKASNLSQTIFKDLSVLADRKKFSTFANDYY